MLPSSRQPISKNERGTISSVGQIIHPPPIPSLLEGGLECFYHRPRWRRDFALTKLALLLTFSIPLFEPVHFARSGEFLAYIPLITFISLYLCWLDGTVCRRGACLLADRRVPDSIRRALVGVCCLGLSPGANKLLRTTWLSLGQTCGFEVL